MRSLLLSFAFNLTRGYPLASCLTLSVFSDLIHLLTSIISFVVGCSVDPLSQKYHFWIYWRRSQSNSVQFYQKDPCIPIGLRECCKRLMIYNPATAREIITDAHFEAMNHEVLAKLDFLFGDKILNSDEILFKEESKWFYQVGDFMMFLPNMEWSYPFVYLQRLSAPRQLDLDLTREHDRVVIEKFGAHGPYKDCPGRCVTGLLPERVTKEHPVGEIPICTKAFISKLVARGRQYPSHNF